MYLLLTPIFNIEVKTSKFSQIKTSFHKRPMREMRLKKIGLPSGIHYCNKGLLPAVFFLIAMFPEFRPFAVFALTSALALKLL